MADDPRKVRTGRLGRLASLARAGLGTASALGLGSERGVERAVAQLRELRGLGTKIGQMAGIVEAALPSELRAKASPLLAQLRADAVRSPPEAIRAVVEQELGTTIAEAFADFSPEPFASASLGQVHRATHHDGRALAVKVQHPGIEAAFTADLSTVASLGRIATTLAMPKDAGTELLDTVRRGFLAELDYLQEADHQTRMRALIAGDPGLEIPSVERALTRRRVLTSAFCVGERVEIARGWDEPIRRAHASAVRRFVLSALTDHGVLYADAHAGNFLFREDGTVGVLDFGSVFSFDEARARSFARLRDAARDRDRDAFARAVPDVFGLPDPAVREAVADVQWLAFGALVRGDVVDEAHMRALLRAVSALKRRVLGRRFEVPPFMPFLMRCLISTNALLLALDAPESGPLGRLPGA